MKRYFLALVFSFCFLLVPTAVLATRSFLPVIEDERAQVSAASPRDFCARRLLSQEEQEALFLLKESAEKGDLEGQRRMMLIYQRANHFNDALYWAVRMEKSEGNKGAFTDADLIEFEFNYCSGM